MKLSSANWILRDGKLLIDCYDREFRKTTVDPEIKPSGFIKKDELDRAKNVTNLVLSGVSAKTFDGQEPCVEATFHSPFDAKEALNDLYTSGLISYELDMGNPSSFVRKWMIEKKVFPEPDPEILFWDMEMDSRKGLPMPDDPSQRILSISGVNNLGEEFFICDDSEEQICQDFFELIQSYPVLVGFNSERWDLPNLIARSAVLGYHYNFRKHQNLDLRKIIMRSDYGRYSSGSLDAISKLWLKEGKVDDFGEFGKSKQLYELFCHNREKLREYNVTDSFLLHRLEKRLNLLKVRAVQAVYSGVLLKDTDFVSRIIDALIMRRLRQRPELLVLRSKRFAENIEGTEEEAAGGYVHTPTRGLYTWVFEFDFASLYPSLMCIWNIGHDTISESGPIKSEVLSFREDPDAEFVLLIKDLLKEREKYKLLENQHEELSEDWIKYEIHQKAFKLISNSCYGSLGSRSGRLYNRDLVESVTLTCQEIVKILMRCAEAVGAKIIYSDTDSIFMIFEGLQEEKAVDAAPKIEKYFNEALKKILVKKYNIPEWRYSTEEKPYGIKLEFQQLFAKLFFSEAKKKYIGQVYNREKTTFAESLTPVGLDSSVSIVGMDMKKYDTSLFLKGMQKKIVDLIFSSNSLEEVPEKAKQEFFKARKLLRCGALDYALIQKTGLRHKLKDYKGNSLQQRLAKQLSDLNLFRPGDAVSYIVTEQSDDLKLVALLDENDFPKITLSGYEYYEKRILDMIARMLGTRLQIKDNLLDRWLEGSQA